MNDCVVHLVAKIHNTEPTTTGQSQSENYTNNEINNSSTSNQDNGNSTISVIQIPLPNNINNWIRQNPNNNHQTNLWIPSFDISTCFETLYQTSITIDNINKCKAEFNKSTNVGNGSNRANIIEPFSLGTSTYEIGQWVDVKDTIDQWLEAQVIDIRVNETTKKHECYIHYNGWGNRWDEWIESSSNRISNFKTFTLLSPSSSFSSPYPAISCDSDFWDITKQNWRSIDSFFYLEKCAGYLKELYKNIQKTIDIRKEKKEDIFKDKMLNDKDKEILFYISQMIPIMDRTGKMLSDISMMFSHLIINNDMYPSWILGHSEKELWDSKIKNEIEEKEGIIKNLKDWEMKWNEQKKVANNTIFTNSEISGQAPIRQRQVIQVNHNTNTTANINTNTISSNNRNSFQISSQHNEVSVGSFTIEPEYNRNIGYNVSSSANDLPFIRRVSNSYQRRNTNDNGSNNYHFLNMDSRIPQSFYPKVNLQSPALLSPGEVMLITGYSPFQEQNIEWLIRTIANSTNYISHHNPVSSVNGNDSIDDNEVYQNDFRRSMPNPRISRRMDNWFNGVEFKDQGTQTDASWWIHQEGNIDINNLSFYSANSS